uniref:Uncharacterized protein n=1 Tax=Mola mola TaxID=94237 RepID=A0A3Q3WF31_MOLML
MAPSHRQPPPPRGPSRTWRSRRPSSPCSQLTALPSALKSRLPTGSPTPRPSRRRDNPPAPASCCSHGRTPQAAQTMGCPVIS